MGDTMQVARVRVVDYDEYERQLRRAKTEKRALDPMLDREAWDEEISRQGLKVRAFSSIVRERHQAEEMNLILDGPEEWTGLFARDRDTRVCVKLVYEDI